MKENQYNSQGRHLTAVQSGPPYTKSSSAFEIHWNSTTAVDDECCLEVMSGE